LKLIELTNGMFTKVSDCDYDYLNKFRWGYMKVRNKGYYARKVTRDGNGDQLFMHKIVAKLMGIQSPQVDHWNEDKLDNQRENIREATNAKNKANESKRINNTSGFKGVCWAKWANKWVSYIKVNYKRIHLGYYENKIDAARAYNKAAIVYFGEYANLNKV